MQEVIAVNQDPAAMPMEPVSSAEGLEVWKKPLSTGKGMAVILFHRNSSSSAGGPASRSSAGTNEVNVEAWAVPAVQVGMPVSMTAHSAAVALDLTGNMMKLKGTSGLCLGALPGLCKCSNPPSPEIGIVVCNASDSTQHWVFDPKTGQVTQRAVSRVPNVVQPKATAEHS
jgi:hypothetical protein